MEKTKRAIEVTKKILSCILIAFTVAMMVFTIFSTLTFDKNERSIFGIRFYVVLSDSMSKSENNADDKVHFNAGDIVIIKEVDDPTTLEAGDIIAFLSQNKESLGKTVTHKIREAKRNARGDLLGYVTYGTNTGANDEAVVEPGYVLGRYAGKIPLIGHFFNFIKTTAGYVVCILIPFLLLILWQGVNTVRLFKQYKREQVADIEAERAALAKEREESAALMRELQALKAELARKTGGDTAPQVPDNTED